MLERSEERTASSFVGSGQNIVFEELPHLRYVSCFIYMLFLFICYIVSSLLCFSTLCANIILWLRYILSIRFISTTPSLLSDSAANRIRVIMALTFMWVFNRNQETAYVGLIVDLIVQLLEATRIRSESTTFLSAYVYVGLLILSYWTSLFTSKWRVLGIVVGKQPNLRYYLEYR